MGQAHRQRSWAWSTPYDAKAGLQQKEAGPWQQPFPFLSHRDGDGGGLYEPGNQ
jgi:hypothetical protein